MPDDGDGPQICVMDCPGLIFPRPLPRAMLEICGVLPVAQVRETLSAVRVLAERLPLEQLLQVTRPDWYDEDGFEWTPLALLEALAEKRKYFYARSGAPDVHRAGLEVLRDVVDGAICLTWDIPRGGAAA